MSFRAVSTVTLDVGGTLLFANPSVGEVYAEVMRAHGIDVRADQLDGNFRRLFSLTRVGPREVVNDELEREFWRDLVWEVIGEYCDPAAYEALFGDLYDAFASPERWRLAEDALTTIEALGLRGYRLAILSNADSRLRNILNATGISSLAESVFISAEVGFEKPDVRIFRHVEEALGVPSEQFLHVGDSEFHDARGAEKAGWERLLLADRFDPENRRIARLKDLLALLLQAA